MIEWLDTLQEALKPYPWAYSAIVAGVLILVAFLVNWITKRILLRGLQHAADLQEDAKLLLMICRGMEQGSVCPVAPGAKIRRCMDLSSHQEESLLNLRCCCLFPLRVLQ